VEQVRALPAYVDTVVVGGGVIGVAVTYWLARLGAAVLLLESRLPAWGASGRNAGLVLGNGASLGTLRQVLDDEAIEAEYGEPGHLALAASDATLASFRQELASRPPTAAPLRVLDRGECEELLRTRISERFVGGRWMPLAGALHPGRFLYGLVGAAVRRGGAVAFRRPVVRLRRVSRGDGWDVRTARGELVRARRVVLAANVWSARLWRPMAKVLAPARGQMLATRPLAFRFLPAMAVDYGALYWRQTADGAVLLGGYGGLDPAAERSARESLNPRIQDALERFLPGAFPAIPDVVVAQRWAGIMDVTPDGRPLAGPWPDDPTLWVAAGFGGHGLPPALPVGHALARAMVHGERPPELDALSPARFARALAC
jgi:glycine/D-amino acid oxidase-like deaminating enzyme